MPDKQVTNDVYERYGLKWADFPRQIVPSAHSDEAELSCARLSFAVYGVYPNLPHNPDHDHIPSRNAEAIAAQSFELGRMIEGGAGLAESSFESERGYRTVSTDQAAALMVWEENRLVLAFRGTANWQDWIHNFTGSTIPPPTIRDDDKYTLHKGFYGLAANLFPPVRDLVDRFDDIRGRGTTKIELTCCGHSLGGALALHAASMFTDTERHFYDFDDRRVLGHVRLAASYTFGAPRLGKGEIWQAISRPHYRLVVRGDPVPSTPPGCEEDFQAAYLEKPSEPPVQPRTALGKVRKAIFARLPSIGFDGRSHEIETYIEAIERKIAAKE